MLVRMLYRNLCKCSYVLSGKDVQIWCIIMKNSFLGETFYLGSGESGSQFVPIFVAIS